MNFRRRTSILAACFAAAALVAMPSAAQAKTFKVTTKNDEADGMCKKSDCSIREALAAAGAATGKSKVNIPKGKYKLSLGELDVTSPVSLKGAGAKKTTIEGDGASRVMNITGGPSSVSGVKVTGGSSQIVSMQELSGDGGGILVTAAERFSLINSAVVGNTAQMSGGGLAAPIESGVATNVSVKRSLIGRNSVTGGVLDGSGGGIFVAGDLKMQNSTVANNSLENASATNRGGGIAAMGNPQGGGGSGISTVKLTNVTVANNAITGAATDGIGGGLGLSDPAMGATVNINARNTAIASNTVVGNPEDCGMVMMGVKSKRNLSSDDTCMFADKKSITNKKAKLKKLRFNGGQTETLLPKRKSPLVDAGTNKKCKAPDQRGVKRPQGKSCDIGAVELKR